MTRTVSPTPLSVLVPEVTLIALSMSLGEWSDDSPALQSIPPPANNIPVRSLKESVLILVVKANSGFTQNPPVMQPVRSRRVLDDCAGARNQSPHQNYITRWN